MRFGNGLPTSIINLMANTDTFGSYIYFGINIIVFVLSASSVIANALKRQLTENVIKYAHFYQSFSLILFYSLFSQIKTNIS